MVESAKYSGKGYGGTPTFRGIHNKAKFLTLYTLMAVEVHHLGRFPRGLTAAQIAGVAGVMRGTLWRRLPVWHRWGYVRRRRRPCAPILPGGMPGPKQFHYRIAERGTRWLERYGHLAPPEWTARWRSNEDGKA